MLESDWRTEKQLGASLLSDGVSYWPRGKVLGGSSMLNYMLYVRGHSKDYDEWRDMGLEGWGYEVCLICSKKHQTKKSYGDLWGTYLNNYD